MCDTEAEGVISCPDAPSIYDIPKVLHREGLDAFVVRRLGLPFRDVDWTVWGELLDRVHSPKQTVTVALVGKYIAVRGDMGGTRRLGSYPAHLQPGSVAAAAYGTTEITERHRHRYEVANAYRDRLSQAGLVFSGTSPDGTLVEFAELPADVHPFFVGTQAHPELKSRPIWPHPLFAAFVQAAATYQDAARLPVPEDEPVGI